MYFFKFHFLLTLLAVLHSGSLRSIKGPVHNGLLRQKKKKGIYIIGHS